MTHEHFIESAASYALDALDAPERATFEAHLADCAECREQVAEYREVAAALAHVAPVVVPPNNTALRDRIVRDARHVRPIGVPTRASPAGAPIAKPLTAAPLPESGRRIIPWTVAIASLAAALAFGFVYRAERDRNARLAAELSTIRADRARSDSVLAAFIGPEVHVVSLAAADQKPAVRVFWNHTRRTFIVTASGLPPAPSGKTYQLWALRKGQQPLSMGMFAVNTSGPTMTTIAVSDAIRDGGFIDDCALTMEPDGGSPQPTETPRLLGSWRHVD